MLLPPSDAAHFLAAYKAMLETYACRQLNRTGYAEARNAFFRDEKSRKDPPTTDPELRKALETALFGKFIVGRHMARGTEIIGPGDQVFRVKGVTDELRQLVKPWNLVLTTVMQFAGHWICDGLFVPQNIQIGPGMRKDFLAKIRDAKPERTRLDTPQPPRLPKGSKPRNLTSPKPLHHNGMLHHLSFAVMDLARSAAFYDAALSTLGYVRVWTDSTAIGYGPAGGGDRVGSVLPTRSTTGRENRCRCSTLSASTLPGDLQADRAARPGHRTSLQ